MNEQELLQLAALLQRFTQLQNNAVDPANMVTQRLHGRGGLLSRPGVNADIVNASVAPVSGLNARLPFQLSSETDPTFAIFTGVTANKGTHPTEACGDAKRPGDLKMCRQWFPFGRAVMDTNVLQVDRLGEITNRGEMRDFRMVGNPFANANTLRPINPRQALADEVSRELFALYYGIHREFQGWIYTGNPANTAGSTGVIEPYGLQSLVNNTYIDLETGQRCRAADSLLYAFPNTDVRTNGMLVHVRLVEMVRHLRQRARQTGFGDTTWILVMSSGMFHALTEVWHCGLNNVQCYPNAPQTQLSVTDVVRMREGMRDGSYITIDSQQVEVVIDDFLPETEPATGTYTSDVYILPVRGGGMNLTYSEYYNLAGPGAMASMLGELAPTGSFEVIDGGRVWWHRKPPTNECVQARMGYKPRYILRAPFLAARASGLRYTPTYQQLSGMPGNSQHYNGGVTTSLVPSVYGPFAS
jgi:hypothetical protein